MIYFQVVVCAVLAVASATLSPVAYSVAPAHSFGYSSLAHHGVTPLHYTAPYAHPYAYSSHAYPYHAYPYHAYPYATPVVAPVAPVEKTQYHSQDVFGQASYGHAEAYQSHNAFQDAAGNKVGAYAYTAPTGEVISTKYVADALGYRAETNAAPAVPLDTPEVAAAKAAHFKAFEAIKSRSRRQAVYTPYAYPHVYSTPLAYHTPVVAPIAKTSAYHSDVITPFSHSSTIDVKHY